MTNESTNNTNINRSSDAGQNRASEVDIEKLADKVYRLMQADLRLTRVRGIPANERRKR